MHDAIHKARITHTHTNGPLPVTIQVGKVPEETFTHSHPSWSSDIIYRLPPFSTIHSILLVLVTCLTVLFDNLSPGPLVFLLVLGPLLHTSMHFFTQSSSSRSTCPYHRSLFCCNTNATSSIPSLSPSSLLGNLSPAIYLRVYRRS